MKLCKTTKIKEFESIELNFERSFIHVFMAHDLMAVAWSNTWMFSRNKKISEILKVYNNECYDELDSVKCVDVHDFDVYKYICKFFEQSKYEVAGRDPISGKAMLKIPYPSEIEDILFKDIFNVKGYELKYFIKMKDEVEKKNIYSISALGFIYYSEKNIVLLSLQWAI